MSLVLIGIDCDSTWMVANALATENSIRAIVIEKPQNSLKLIARRTKSLGWLNVFGQVLFIIYSKLLSLCYKSRTQEIIKAHFLTCEVPKGIEIIKMNSVNDPQSIALVRDLQSQLIVINGTRILSKDFLSQIKVPIINMHAGITPKYRGVHGAYWALVNSDKENMGVTVHLVDPGIDTGNVLYQDKIQITPQDSFVTYPYLQFAAGIPLLKKAVKDGLNDQLKTMSSNLNSHLYYHPTLWQYLYSRILKGVR